jgi:hypothetical protein
MFRLTTAVERKALARRERIKSIKAVPKRINTPAVVSKHACELVGGRSAQFESALKWTTAKIAPRFTGSGVFEWDGRHSIFKGPLVQIFIFIE